MTAPVDGGAAFPSVCLNDPGHPASVPGMSMRDWFAGQALQGLISAKGYHERSVAATDAYNLADAMLAARVVQP